MKNLVIFKYGAYQSELSSGELNLHNTAATLQATNNKYFSIVPTSNYEKGTSI